MKQFKGTPGPWFAQSNGMVLSGEYYVDNRPHKYLICEPSLDSRYMENAKLIAAAPELLEALRWIINNSDPFSALEMHHNVDVVALYENAVNAINKALGE